MVSDYVRAVIGVAPRHHGSSSITCCATCAAPILVFTVTLVADAIIFEASLTFLSAGIAEPTPTGQHPPRRRPQRRSVRPLVAGALPGLAIMITLPGTEHPV